MTAQNGDDAPPRQLADDAPPRQPTDDAPPRQLTDGVAAAPEIDRRMVESLVCPITHGALTLDPERKELVSAHAGLAFPIRDGIPIMLESEARRLEDQ